MLSYSSLFAISHLLSTIMHARRLLSTKPAIFSSRSKKGSLASKTTSAMLEFSSISFVRISANFSIPTILPRRLRPAVSTKVSCLSLYSILSSIGSIVVPATLLTTERSSPKSALRSELLPTLVRPMMEILIWLISSGLYSLILSFCAKMESSVNSSSSSSSSV